MLCQTWMFLESQRLEQSNYLNFSRATPLDSKVYLWLDQAWAGFFGFRPSSPWVSRQFSPTGIQTCCSVIGFERVMFPSHPTLTLSLPVNPLEPYFSSSDRGELAYNFLTGMCRLVSSPIGCCYSETWRDCASCFMICSLGLNMVLKKFVVWC